MTAVARYRRDDGAVRLALVEDGGLHDAGPAGAGGFVPTAEAWAALRPTGAPPIALDHARLLAPVDPRQVLCIGLNYRDHAAESGQPLPAEPLVFAKLPSAIVGPGEPIVVPPHETAPDWEAELALVVGTPARDLEPERSLAAIGGYTAFNDVSGRRAQLGDGQWTRGKSFDTFGPLGPAIASAVGVDWGALAVRCVVSGETMQDGTTADLVFGVATLVSYLSRQFTLQPGDVIATGTPAGVGFGRDPQRWLRDGDVVDVRVADLPPLINPVVVRAS